MEILNENDFLNAPGDFNHDILVLRVTLPSGESTHVYVESSGRILRVGSNAALVQDPKHVVEMTKKEAKESALHEEKLRNEYKILNAFADTDEALMLQVFFEKIPEKDRTPEAFMFLDVLMSSPNRMTELVIKKQECGTRAYFRVKGTSFIYEHKFDLQEDLAKLETKIPELS